jgi:hypothetical protein
MGMGDDTLVGETEQPWLERTPGDYLAVLPQLEQWAARQRRIGTAWLAAMAVPLLLNVIIGAYRLPQDWLYMVIALLLLGVAVFGFGWIYYRTRKDSGNAAGGEACQRLKHAALSQRILMGEAAASDSTLRRSRSAGVWNVRSDPLEYLKYVADNQGAYLQYDEPSPSGGKRRCGRQRTGGRKSYWLLAIPIAFIAISVICSLELGWTVEQGFISTLFACLALVALGLPPIARASSAVELATFLRDEWAGWQDKDRASLRKTEQSATLSRILNELEFSKVDVGLKPWRFYPLPLMISALVLIAGWRYFAICLALAVLFVIIYHLLFKHLHSGYRKQVRRALDKSPLIEKVTSGKVQAVKLAGFTPWPWRYYADKPAPPSNITTQTGKIIWRVMYNLDWYLGPPRRLFRPHWLCSWLFLLVPIALGAAIVCLLGTTHTVSFDPGQSLVMLAGTLLFIFVMGVLAWPSISYRYTVEVWTSELLAHLRERLVS